VAHLHSGNKLSQHIGTEGARAKGGVRGDLGYGDGYLLGIFLVALGGHGDFHELAVIRNLRGGIRVGRRFGQQTNNGTRDT
jgi:hypothetical protein